MIFVPHSKALRAVTTRDDRGRLVSITDPLGAVTTQTYTDLDRVASRTDPLGRTTTAEYDAADPLGLQPVTDAQLTAYAEARQGALATAGHAIGEWWNENWEYVAGGAMVIAGGLMMATGVGGPIGLALIGAGADTIIQKATTGEVNWGQVPLSGAFGLVPGAGAAGGLLVHAGVNAAEGAVENTAQYLISGQPITPGGLLSNAASGAAISTVTAGALSRVPAGSAINRLDEEVPQFVDLASPARREHILSSDSTGGGHRWPGAEGKTPFPQGWSDDKIMHEISDVATDPSLTWRQQIGSPGAEFTKNGRPVRYAVDGERDGVSLRVIIEPSGDGIISGFPLR